MVGGISFGGLGSGLDTGAIIDALLAVERLPIKQLETRKELEQKKLSLLSTFKGHVLALRDKAKELGASSGFLSFAVKPSAEGFATFSASGSAVAGSHSLRVDRLATVDRWAFDAVADPDADLASADGQSLSFTYDGQAYDVSVAQSASSLNEIAAAVKGAVDGAVNVSVVNAGTASSPSWQLVLSGTDSGSDLRFSGLSSTIAGLTIDGTGPDASGNPQSANNLTVANDAQALVDGLLVTRSDNDFSDVIEGVTINLTKADPATTITFTVEADKEAIKARVAEFVGAYNQVVQFINGQSSFSEEDGAGGELFGDNALRTIRRTLTTTLFGQSAAAIQGDTLGYGTLRLVGIETNSDGTLKINDAVFDQKIDANLDAFADLFVDSDGFDNAGALPGTPGYYTDLTADTGLADDLFRAIDQIVLSYQDSSGSFYKGLFEARTQAINDTIALFDDQIAQRELRLEQYEQQLVARFSALEALMAQFQAQSAYLAQNLS